MPIHYQNDRNLYVPRIEKVSEQSISFFSEVYARAAASLKSIIEIPSTGTGNTPIPDEINPIIAFTGERGSGKTSAMLSFAYALENGEYPDVDALFHVLPVIEPSRLSNGENVLDYIISKMFITFKEGLNRVDSRRGVPDFEKRRLLLENFKNVHDAARALCKDKKDRYELDDSLENLRYISAGSQLRELFYRLANEYLDLVLGIDIRFGKKKYLVICIDDLDLNPQMGYEICEDIRKNLNLPNVIVLFSAKLQQLTDIIKQYFTSSFTSNGQVSDSIDNMAASYLTKLIPSRRRCALPVFDALMFGREMLKITLGNTPCREVGLVDELLRLLFEKTGLILLKNRFGINDLLPANLRNIIHLLDILLNMESPKMFADGKPVLGDRVLARNIEILENFIAENLFPDDIDVRFLDIIKGVHKMHWRIINQYIVRRIGLLIKEADPDFDANSEDDGTKDICSLQTLAENVSVGDVLFMLRKANTAFGGRGIEQFTAIVKAIYSLKLVRLAFLPDDTESRGGAEPGVLMCIARQRLHEMLGGLIYNPHGQEIVQMKRDWRPDEEYKNVYITSSNGNCVNVKQLDETVDFQLDINRASEVLLAENWLELHTVSIGRSFSKSTSPRWKRSDWTVPYYSTLHTGREKYFTFSYMAVFSNLLIINPVFCPGWEEAYFSVIPIFSADYLNRFVELLPNEVKENRKPKVLEDNEYYNHFLLSSIDIAKRLNQDIVSSNNNFRKWLANSLSCFHQIRENRVFNNIIGIWNLRSVNSLRGYITIFRGMQDEAAASENASELISAIYQSISTKSSDLTGEQISLIKKTRDYLSTQRSVLKKLSSDANIENHKTRILNRLSETIETLEDEVTDG